jgi:hypothetical protein
LEPLHARLQLLRVLFEHIHLNKTVPHRIGQVFQLLSQFFRLV